MENKVPTKVYLHLEDQERIKKWIRVNTYTETGGNLFGLWTHDGNFVLKVVTGPGPNSTRHSFTMDEGYTKHVEEFLKKQHMLCRVGEWHYRSYSSRLVPKNSEEEMIRSKMPPGPSWFVLLVATTDTLRPFFISKRGHVEEGFLTILQIQNPYMKNDQIVKTLEGRSVMQQNTPVSYADNTRAVVTTTRNTSPVSYADNTRAVATTTRNTSPASYTNNTGATAPSARNTSVRYADNTRPVVPSGTSVREADVKETQWYSTEDGIKTLGEIIKEIKSTLKSEVEMSRDACSQDLTLGFVYKGREVTLDFPAGFPRSRAQIKDGFGRKRALNISTYTLSLSISIAFNIVRECQKYLRGYFA